MCVCECVCVGRKGKSFLSRFIYIERLLFTHIRDPWAFLSPFPIKSFGPQERMDSMIQETALTSKKSAFQIFGTLWRRSEMERGSKGAEWDPLWLQKNYVCLEPCLSWKERMEEDSWPQRRIWVMSQQLNKHLHLSPKIKLKTKFESSGERGKKRESSLFLFSKGEIWDWEQFSPWPMQKT